MMMIFSLTFLNVARAAEDVSCFRPVHPYNQKYSTVKILSFEGKVQKVKVTLADSNQILEDQNPEMSSRRLAPICHGTLSGRYLCTPWSTASEFKNFEKNVIISVYFESQNTGVIQLQNESQEFKMKQISCF
jgi:hypothetical protein